MSRKGGVLSVSRITLNAQAEELGSDTDATFRKDFLNAISHIGLGRDEVVALVEASSGRPFAAFTATDLLPVLGELLALARCIHAADDARPACDV
jgi:hypothetical protein